MCDDWKELEQFNAHQEDTRKRSEFLAKAIFLISGSALTLSINLFLGDKAPKISLELLCLLRQAWIALFGSIAGFVIVFCVMIIRDYTFGERWRQQLRDPSQEVAHMKWPDITMWSIGTLSVLTFLIGLAELAWVSCSLLSKAS